MFEKLSKNEQNKLLRLKEVISSYKSAVIAYSGGIDSTLLSYLSHIILAQKSLIVTINSEFMTNIELAEASNLAGEFGFNHRIIDFNILNYPEIVKNDSKRCKYCKELVFSKMVELAEANNLQNVFDGSNTDDLKDYRPGFEAIQKFGVKSPFIEADIGKTDIRNLAKALNLPNWNKPSMACLASRIPYGTNITTQNINMVQQAELYLAQLGYTGFRVRHHSNIARIELCPEDIEPFIRNHKEEVNLQLKEIGYNYVCLDLSGYRTGSLNELINK